LNDCRVDDEAGGDVHKEDEEGVGAEVHIWDKYSADCAVVEGALEPLGGVGVGGVFVEVCEVTAKTAYAFGAHGVAFWGFSLDRVLNTLMRVVKKHGAYYRPWLKSLCCSASVC